MTVRVKPELPWSSQHAGDARVCNVYQGKPQATGGHVSYKPARPEGPGFPGFLGPTSWIPVLDVEP
jgi:hypothetical protein